MTTNKGAGRRTNEDRVYSRNTVLLARLLGERIRLARRQRRWSEAEMAERARISRATLRKIESGDFGVALGLVLEVCTVVGVTLLDAADPAEASSDLEKTRLMLATQPRRIRRPAATGRFDDDF